jgi:hypothetical protein
MKRRKRRVRIEHTVIIDVPEEQLVEIVLRLIEPARIQNEPARIQNEPEALPPPAK